MLEHYKSVESAHRSLMRKSLAHITPYVRPGERLLDFGCGPGLFVLESRLEGYDAVGLDIADWAREASEHWHVPIDVCRLESAPYAPGSFDAVVSVVSFEHLDDPAAITAGLVRLLRPGGIFAVISVPNGRGLPWLLLKQRWWDLHPPAHLHFFTPRSMKALLRRNGLSLLKLRTTGVGTDFFARLLGRPSGAKTGLDCFQQEMSGASSADDRSSWFRRLLKRVALPTMNWCLDVTRLGNNLTAIARKQ